MDYARLGCIGASIIIRMVHVHHVGIHWSNNDGLRTKPANPTRKTAFLSPKTKSQILKGKEKSKTATD